MGLFTKRRSQDYQGFAKYTDEYNRHTQSAAAQNLQRAQSLSSASHAAMAALQKHQKQPPTTAGTRPRVSQNRPAARANSLGGYQRANSLQSYTYTPKASYVTGPARQQQQQPPQQYQQRTQSLRSNSLASGRRNFVAQPVFPEEDEEFLGEDGESDVVVTTKTTKVLDAQGRTRSITTETIRQLPDGSNIIETKTTNILRLGSRANSRANSLQGGPTGAHAPGHTYSLKKIEEDLQDFEYNYLDHAPPRPLRGPEPVYEEPEPLYEEPEPIAAPPVKAVSMSPVLAEYRSNSLTSTQSPRKLKSILKSSSSAANAAAAVAASTSSNPNSSSPSLPPLAGNGTRQAPVHGPRNHPDEASVTESEDSRKVRREPLKPASLKLQPAPEIGTSHRHGSLTSAGNSIKFLDTVETIPYTYTENYAEIANEEKHKKEQALQNNVDLYTKALQVATEKVYGSPRVASGQFAAPAVTESPKSVNSQNFAEKKSEKKLKSDEKLSKTEASGVSKNYVYTNHHKDFSIRSLRDPGADHHSSRKERAKEEKKQLKEEEKEHAERLKAAERQAKEEERQEAERAKAAEKQKKQEEKEAKKREKSTFSLFKRNKRHGSVSGSSFGSFERKHSVPIEQVAPYIDPVSDRTTPQSNGLSENHRISIPENVPSTPKAVPNVGKVAEPKPAVSPPSSKSKDFHNIPPVNVPVASAPHEGPAKQDFSRLSNNTQVPSEPEPSLQLAKSQTFDEDDDEFVDVPDDIGDDTEKRVPVIPLLDRTGVASSVPPENLANRPEIADTNATSTSKSSESIKIPERGDLERQPDTTLPAKTSKVDSIPAAENLVLKPISLEELPTLVSGDNGTPKVLNKRDHHVFQPRDLNEIKQDFLGNVHHVYTLDAMGKSESLSGKSPNFNKQTLDYQPQQTLPTPSSTLELSQKPNNHTLQPKQFNADNVKVPENVGSDSILDVGEGHRVNPDAQHGYSIPQENTPQVETKENPEASEGTSKKKKKTSRFKKVIEKYFINSYPR